MQDSISLIRRLEESLQDGAGVYVSAENIPKVYFADLASDIRRSVCEPFEISAIVTQPGFPGDRERAEGETIRATCVAHRAGYWLAYDEKRDEFLCFWGPSIEQLSAPGIFGGALYCWSA